MLLGRHERLGQVGDGLMGLLDQVEGQPLGRLGAHAGQFFQLFDQPSQGFGVEQRVSLLSS
ncbi:hypothetical protein D3C72_2592870 [compost metagenome]